MQQKELSLVVTESNLQDRIINEVACACRNGLTTIYEAHGVYSKGRKE